MEIIVQKGPGIFLTSCSQTSMEMDCSVLPRPISSATQVRRIYEPPEKHLGTPQYAIHFVFPERYQPVKAVELDESKRGGAAQRRQWADLIVVHSDILEARRLMSQFGAASGCVLVRNLVEV